MPPPQQRQLLERSLSMWLGLLPVVAAEIRVTGLIPGLVNLIERRHTVDEWVRLKPHTVSLILRHVAEHLRRLEPCPDRFREAAKAYLKEYEEQELKNLRDVLEHQAEYLAGSGRHQELVLDANSTVTFGAGSGGRQDEVWIYAFGREYRIGDLLRSAERLRRAVGS